MKAIVVHYTATTQKEFEVRAYFNIYCPEHSIYASAHYIIGKQGKQLHAVPDDEVAYHCGATQYTKAAQNYFGAYCSSTNSPNNCTIGIEMCCINEYGQHSYATLDSAAELCAELLLRYDLTTKNLFRHYDITGKVCPLTFVKNNGALWQSFKDNVQYKLDLAAKGYEVYGTY